MYYYLGGGLRTILYGPNESKTLTSVTGFRTSYKPVTRSGVVKKISFQDSVILSGGSLTLKLLKNGSPTGDQLVIGEGENYNMYVWDVNISVNAGDSIGAIAETDADFDIGLASNMDIYIGVEVQS